MSAVQAEEAARRVEQQAAEAARRAAEREERLRRAAEYEEPEWVKASEAVASDSEVRAAASLFFVSVSLGQEISLFALVYFCFSVT
jgi:hypothetical protein